MSMEKPKQIKNTKISKQELLAIAIRKDFGSFLEKVFYTLRGKKKYHRNWHLKVFAKCVEDIISGAETSMIINVPPRCLKSICFSVAMPAFILGHDPSTAFVCISHNQRLADKHGIDFLTVIESDWYKEYYPKVKISPRAHSKDDVQTTKGGRRLAIGLDAGLVGHGGDYIIVDDPNDTENLSIKRLETINRKFKRKILSRFDDQTTGRMIIVMQRLHEHDLTGDLINENNKWKLIKIPAIAIEDEVWNLGENEIHIRKKGESIHDQRLPLSKLADIRKDLGTLDFEAQFQQEPLPERGFIVDLGWLNYYRTLPDFSRILISWDVACKTGKNNDYSVCTIWGVIGGSPREYYLLYVYREKIEFPKLRKKVRNFYNQCKEKYGCSVFVLVEDTVSGTPLIQDLKQENIIIRAVQPKGDKESRFIETSSIFEQGRIFLPKKDSPWKTEYINELLRFPQTKHDDQVDSTTQALLWDYRINEDYFKQVPLHGTINTYTVKIPKQNPVGMDFTRTSFIRTKSMRPSKYDHLDPKTAFIMRMLDRP